jgi:recombination associated protein RdgC
MFKNALVYRIDLWPSPTLTDMATHLDAARFVPCGTTQKESVGWVEPRGEAHGALIESVAGHWILQLCSETKAVPSGVVKTELDVQLAKIEAQTGRRLKGKAAREIKEEIIHTLLPRAFPKRSTTWVWIDVNQQRVLIAAASAKKADAVVTHLVDLMGGELRLSLVQTELSPTTAMAAWLSDKAAPSPFSLDRECELKQPDSEKSAVRYARHNLEIDELAEHIRQGKLPTQLAMTWNGRVSFVLSETLALKKIKLLDGVIEGPGKSAGHTNPADSGFDTDVAISTGELRLLLADLLAALGGVSELGAAPTTGTQAAAPSANSRSAADAPPWATTAAPEPANV